MSDSANHSSSTHVRVQGPKGELAMQFPETMVFTEVRISPFTSPHLTFRPPEGRRPQRSACMTFRPTTYCVPRPPSSPFLFLTKGDGEIKVARANDSKKAREGHGLYRTLANNMMVGVSTGFEKKLKLVGVGYKAAMQGKQLNLSLGYAHPVLLDVPAGLEVKCDSATDITVSGYDKVEVGNFAAIIRSKRKPEPYKGKGVRYADEVVIIKEGKRK